MTLSQYILPPPPGPHGVRLALPIRRAWPIPIQHLVVRCLLLAAVLLLAHPASAQFQGEVQADSANFTLNTTGGGPVGQGITKVDSANFTVDTAGSLPAGQGIGLSDSPNFTLDTTGSSGLATDSKNFTLDTRGTSGTIAAFRLLNPLAPRGSPFSFSFTNLFGESFSVFGATNISIPFSNWTFLGKLTDNPPGQYQFSDPQITNYPKRFYRVSSP